MRAPAVVEGLARLVVLWGLFVGLGACDLSGASLAPSASGSGSGTAEGNVDASGAAAAAAAALAKCPRLQTGGDAGRVRWAADFGLDATTSQKVKAGVMAALELHALAGRFDAKLRAACAGLAADLGAGGGQASASEACRAALQAAADLRGKLGASARVRVRVTPPVCAVALDASAKCHAECDASVTPGQAELRCEGGELVGRCSAQCRGTCHLDAAAQCAGTCQGSCDAQFSGRCGGACNGTCDGRPSQGAACAGRCEGSCAAEAQGSCGGKCQGECKLSAAASCSGECQGSCSVAFQAPRCTGKVVPPKASAECSAACDAKLAAQVQCRPARVDLVVEGAADAALAARYTAAIKKHLPAVAELAIGMRGLAAKAAADVKVVLGGLQAVVGSLSGSGGAGARLATCVAAPFQAAFAAVASLEVNLRVAVDVQGKVGT